MSMINISGVPNLGIPAMGGFPTPNPSAGLNNAQASYANNQAFFDRQAANLGAANAYDPWANSPGGFGGQTAAYAGLGAAYGRGTGGFGLMPGGGQAPAGRVGTIGNPGTSNPGYLDDGGPPPNSGYPSGSVVRGPDLPNLSPSMLAQPPISYLGNPAGQPFGSGGFSDRGASPFFGGTSPIPNLSGGGMPFGGGGFSPGSRNSIAQQVAGGPSGPMSSPDMQRLLGYNPNQPVQGPAEPPVGSTHAPTPPMPPFQGYENAFWQFRQGGDQTPQQAQNQPALDEMLRWNGRGTGVMPDQPDLPPSNSIFEHAFDSLPEGGGFADRFATGRYFQPGQPSEYTTAPYQDIGGTMRGPSQMPPGFSTPYSFDNPGGALGRGGFQGTQAPIMNANPDDEPSGDTLTARDRAIGQGSGGGFYPTPFNQGQFVPSSPFGSGAGVGGRPGGSGGLGTGVGTQMPNTAPPFFGGAGSGFGAPGSTQSGGLYAGRRSPGVLGQMPGFIGTSQDAYGNPFIQGSAPPHELLGSRLGGGYGIGGLGQGTAFRGVLGR